MNKSPIDPIDELVAFLKKADNYTQDTRNWPDATEPRAPQPPMSPGCTCHQGEKLYCPVHGLNSDPEAAELDHSWSLPENHPVGYPQDQPRNWTQAVSSVSGNVGQQHKVMPFVGNLIEVKEGFVPFSPIKHFTGGLFHNVENDSERRIGLVEDDALLVSHARSVSPPPDSILVGQDELLPKSGSDDNQAQYNSGTPKDDANQDRQKVTRSQDYQQNTQPADDVTDTVSPGHTPKPSYTSADQVDNAQNSFHTWSVTRIASHFDDPAIPAIHTSSIPDAPPQPEPRPRKLVIHRDVDGRMASIEEVYT